MFRRIHRPWGLCLRSVAGWFRHASFHKCVLLRTIENFHTAMSVEGLPAQARWLLGSDKSAARIELAQGQLPPQWAKLLIQTISSSWSLSCLCCGLRRPMGQASRYLIRNLLSGHANQDRCDSRSIPMRLFLDRCSWSQKVLPAPSASWRFD